MSARSIAFGCLLGLFGAAAFHVAPARGAEPDLATRIAHLEEQSAALQGAVGELRESLGRNAKDAENLRLRMTTVEGYLQALQGAFASLAPGAGTAGPTTGGPAVPDGYVDQMEFFRDERNDVVRLRIISGRITGLPQRGRLELAVSLTDSDGLVRKTFEATSDVVATGEVVRLDTRITLSSDGDQDRWFRELAGRDGKPDRARVRNLVVKFQVLSVLPPPK